MSRPLPQTIAEWPRNSRETLRIRLDRFKDADVVDIRSWWRNQDGELCPGRAGITLAARHLPSLASGLVKALEQARTDGLLDEGGDDATV